MVPVRDREADHVHTACVGSCVTSRIMPQATTMNFYTIPNIAPHADIGASRAAYQHSVLLAHPDNGGSKEAFRPGVIAFEILSHTRCRAVFDCAEYQTDSLTPFFFPGRVKRLRSEEVCLEHAHREPECQGIGGKQYLMRLLQGHTCRKRKNIRRTAPDSSMMFRHRALERLRLALQMMDITARRRAVPGL